MSWTKLYLWIYQISQESTPIGLLSRMISNDTWLQSHTHFHSYFITPKARKIHVLSGKFIEWMNEFIELQYSSNFLFIRVSVWLQATPTKWVIRMRHCVVGVSIRRVSGCCENTSCHVLCTVVLKAALGLLAISKTWKPENYGEWCVLFKRHRWRQARVWSQCADWEVKPKSWGFF